MTDDELRKILDTHDTIVAATIRKIAIDGRGGPLRNWIVVMDIDEIVHGSTIGPTIFVFVHSPTQEFPRLDEKERIGAKTLWAFKTEADKIRAAVHLTTLDRFGEMAKRVRAMLTCSD
jgi:hypothetical protein